MKTVKKIGAWATAMVCAFTLCTAPVMAQHQQQKQHQQKQQQQNPKLSDAEVASVAVVANQIDIDHARIAQKRSKNEDVLNFAQTMISDHQAVIDQAAALVKKLNVTPKDNAVSKQLQADAAKASKMLQTKSGAAFDKAYVDNEVTYHQAVIEAVEGLLIPETENAELKELLQNVVPALQAHLEHAQMLQKQLQDQ